MNDSQPKVAVAQIGARMHYAVPALLHRAGMLEALYTDLCAEVGWVRAARCLLPDSVLPRAAKRLMARRVPDVPRNRIIGFNAYGLARIYERGKAHTPSEMFRHLLRANSAFGRRVVQRGFGHANAVYTFNGAALEILEYARSHSIRTVLEQTSAPIGYDERLLADERQRWPGWEFEGAAPADWQPLADREKQEWSLADSIVCGSNYVVQAMQTEQGPIERCAVVPYGVDAQKFHQTQPRVRGQRLRVLCVATVQLRKGVQYLMEAARLLKDELVDVRLVGPVHVSKDALNELNKTLTVVGEMPRSQIHAEYANADLFVLPTLSEGSATVCYEALAAGLPVVTTPNAGSVIRDGVDGMIVPIRDPRSLANQIAVLSRDRKLLDEMSQQALKTAGEYTWDQYGRRLIEVITRR